jgi:hypothetical protein
VSLGQFMTIDLTLWINGSLQFVHRPVVEVSCFPRIQQSRCFPPLTRGRKHIQFPKRSVVFCSLDTGRWIKSKPPSNPKRYISQSDRFRIYFHTVHSNSTFSLALGSIPFIFKSVRRFLSSRHSFGNIFFFVLCDTYDFLRSSRSGTGSTHPREYNWGTTWMEN